MKVLDRNTYSRFKNLLMSRFGRRRLWLAGGGLLFVALLLGGLEIAARDNRAQGLEAHERGEFSTAFKRLRPMARGGDAEARYTLGHMLIHGQGTMKDEAAAVGWYRMAAEQGHAEAQFALAELLLRGADVELDTARAAHWLLRAAGQGHAHAQYWLGVLYQTGEGVEADPAASAGWFRRAAEQGWPDAVLRMAVLTGEGRGVPRNAAQSIRWYEKSALQGQRMAQRKTGEAYRDGLGVGADPVQAYAWLTIAGKAGDDEAFAAAWTIAAFLTPKQVGEAEALMRRLLRQINKA
jgi:hypothetical protein